MIILFNKGEQNFDTLGLGVLKDAQTCLITEELNGSFELEMEYPLSGSHYSDIQLERIIYAKPNMHDDPQPFRIYSITKPLNEMVTVNAAHISYDMSGYLIKPFETTGSESPNKIDIALQMIKDKTFPPSPFTFELGFGKTSDADMVLEAPTTQRGVLFGQDGSILDTYGGEYKFDKFKVELLDRRGEDNGVSIRHGKNMREFEQEISSAGVYTGIFPFFTRTTTDTTVTQQPYFLSCYIRDNTLSYSADWLSMQFGGDVLRQFVDDAPTEIKADNDYNGLVIYFLKFVNFSDLSDIRDCYIVNNDEDERFTLNWLSELDGGDHVVPVENVGYKVITEGDYVNKIYIWDGNKYITKPLMYGDCEINPSVTQYGEDWLQDITPTDFTQKGAIRNAYKISSADEDYNNKVYVWEGNEYVEYKGTGFYYSYVEEGRKLPKFPLMKTVPNTEERTVYIDLSHGEDNPNVIKSYITNNEEYGPNWLSESSSEEGVPLEGTDINLYKIMTVGPHKDKIYCWDKVEGIFKLFDTREDGVVFISGVDENGIAFENVVPKRIQSVDLSQEFEDEPSIFMFSEAVKKYMGYNEKVLRVIQDSFTVSFINLSDSDEYQQFRNLEKVLLGDTIYIHHERLGVNASARVITTNYNVLTERYDEIELGEKKSRFTSNAVVAGDNVSSLDNDSDYIDRTRVGKMVADTVTADYILSQNAKFTEAQVDQLFSDNIIIENSLMARYSLIDEMVAYLLTAEDAKINKKLKAGEVEVAGKLTALSGEIKSSIYIGEKEDEEGYNFEVDQHGNAKANSLEITGGSIKLGKRDDYNYNFQVDPDGSITAKSLSFTQTGSVEEDDGEEIKKIPLTTTITGGVLTTNSVNFNDNLRLLLEEGDDYRFHTMEISANATVRPSSEKITKIFPKKLMKPVLVGDNIYFGSSDTSFTGGAVDYSIGKYNVITGVQETIPVPLSDRWSFPVAIGTNIYFMGYNTYNAVINKFDTINNNITRYELPFSMSVSSISNYVVIGNTIYFSPMDSSYARIRSFNTMTGLANKTDILDNSVFWGKPIVVGTDIYFGSSGAASSFICKYSTITGASTKISVPSGGWYKPVIFGDDIYFGNNYSGSNKSSIGKFNTLTDTGSIITVPTGRTWDNPIVVGSNIYFGGGEYGNTGTSTIGKYDTISQTADLLDVGHGATTEKPIVINDIIYFTNGSSKNTKTLKIIDTNFDSGKSIYTFDEVCDEIIVVGNYVYAISNNSIIKMDSLYSGIKYTVALSLNITFKDIKGDVLLDESSFFDNDLSLTYRYLVGSQPYFDKEITIPKETPSGLFVLYYDHDYDSVLTPNIIIDFYYPSVIPESTGEVNGLTLNTELIPRSDDAHDLGDEYHKWSDIYATNGSINTSDKKEKKDISYDLINYEEFFDKLKPALFKFIKGTSGRTHLGFIAQDIEQSLIESGLTLDQYAGITKTLKKTSKTKEESELDDSDYIYGLRYSELHAMEVAEIQKLKKEVATLKEQINKKEGNDNG